MQAEPEAAAAAQVLADLAQVAAVAALHKNV
jgi:hypothetical protein